jgi:D-lactate dehydrogenase (cytochrome)
MSTELIQILDGRNEEYLSDESRLKGFADSISFREQRKRRLRSLGGFQRFVSITAKGAKTGICGAAFPSAAIH